jgi:hypothetical protein
VYALSKRAQGNGGRSHTLRACTHSLAALPKRRAQKKNQDNINSRLALVMKSGKSTLGYKTCLKTLRSGKGEEAMAMAGAHNAICGEERRRRRRLFSPPGDGKQRCRQRLRGRGAGSFQERAGFASRQSRQLGSRR